MYTVSVPVTNLPGYHALDCERTLNELKRVGAGRVFLCVCRSIAAPEVRARELAALRVHLPYFENAGLQTGVWLSSLGHGGKLVSTVGENVDLPYQRMVGLSGETSEDSFCPLDDAYAENFSDWISDIARAGAKLIMLDDDYRLSYRDNGLSCVCERHMARYREMTGEDLTYEEIKARIYTGGPNPYRDAWLKLRGDTLLDLARLCRAKLDKVNPDARLGFCSVLSTWDIDGTDAIELTYAFAGRAKPFLRAIGAPYWASKRNWGARVGDIIELTRMEAAWCKGTGIELFSEGDVYPRPRYNTPAAFVECFDQALRADGCMDGILKYVLDYYASPVYETGYIDRHVRNKRVYDWIDKHFAGKRAVGARPMPAMRKTAMARFPDTLKPEAIYTDGLFFSMEQRLLANNGAPSAYEGDGVRLAFGENARWLTDEDIARGVMLDAPGAMILSRRGVDVGMLSCEAAQCAWLCERFINENETVPCAERGLYDIHLKPGAERVSEFLLSDASAPASYRYEDARGRRFFVYAFDAFAAQSQLYGNMRARRLSKDIAWLGEKLPAACVANPYLYLLAKRGDTGMTVGLWNLSEDVLLPCEITLDRAYARAESFGVSGRLEGARFLTTSEVAPFEFAGLELFE